MTVTEDIDQQIAMRLFGHDPTAVCPGPVEEYVESWPPEWNCRSCGEGWENPPPEQHLRQHYRTYAESILGAWKVVEKMRERGWNVSVERDQESLWCCVFYRGGDMAMEDWNPHIATNESAPRTICEAALKALRDE